MIRCPNNEDMWVLKRDFDDLKAENEKLKETIESMKRDKKHYDGVRDDHNSNIMLIHKLRDGLLATLKHLDEWGKV